MRASQRWLFPHPRPLVERFGEDFFRRLPERPAGVAPERWPDVSQHAPGAEWPTGGAWVHEEVLFIRTHQAFEVWFSLVLHEVGSVVAEAASLWRDAIMLLVVLGFLFAAALAAMRQLRKREAADAALRESEARLKLAIGAAKASLWERDLRNRKIYLSAEYQRQIGLGPEDFHGEYEYWENRLHPEDRDRALALVKDCSEGRTAGYDSEYRLRHTDGGYRWFLSRGALVRDETGRPKRLIGVLIDITGRKRAEEAMRESEERFRSLTKLSSDMYWEQDDQFRFTSISGTESLTSPAAGTSVVPVRSPPPLLPVMQSYSSV